MSPETHQFLIRGGEGLGGWVWVVVRGEVVRGGAAGGEGGEGMGKTHKMRDLEFARRSIGSTGSRGSRTLPSTRAMGPRGMRIPCKNAYKMPPSYADTM